MNKISNSHATETAETIVLIGNASDTMLDFRSGLIAALTKQGKTVYALAPNYDEEFRDAISRLGAIPVDYDLNRAGLSPMADIRNTWRLSRKLREIAPDAVFAYFAKPVIFGTIAAYLAGVKRRVGMLEGLGYAFTVGPGGASNKQHLVKRVQVLLYRLALPLLERIIFLNPDDRSELLDTHRIRARQADVLGGIGLDLSAYSYSQPPVSPVRFVFVARLLAEKGVHEYVEAARLVRGQYPDARFLLLGGLDEHNPGGVSGQWVEQHVEEGLVESPGYVNNVSDWVASASVFVLPSYREGLPRSTQEAMAIGRPVITTDVPGCRETVSDGENGFLVPPWSPEAVAEKMIYFIEHPEKITAMGRVSHEMALEKFDEVKINRQLVEWLCTSD